MIADGIWASAKELRSQETLWWLRENITAEGIHLIADQVELSLGALRALAGEVEGKPRSRSVSA